MGSSGTDGLGGRRARVRLDQLVEGLTDAEIVADETGEIVFATAKVEAMFGFRREELVGKPVELLLPERLGRRHADHRMKYISEPRSRRMGLGYELVGQRKDGSEFPVAIDLTLIESAKGSLVAAVIADISSRQYLAEALRQSQKMETLGRLVSGVAHDFNNLLTVIGGYAILTAKNASDPQLKADLEQIRHAVERGCDLTASLLAFSRHEPTRRTIVDLNRTVRSLEPMLRRLIDANIELVITHDPAVEPIEGDQAQIEQLLMNLVINARDAMPAGGKLVIATSSAGLGVDDVAAHPDLKAGRHSVLTVSDTGGGMDDVTRERLFEPFFTTKEKGEGTGLGLARVHAIVEQHGGHVSVDSRPGEGAVFAVYLPVAAERPDPEVPDALREETVGPPRGGTILLVDDNEAVGTMCQRVLAGFGYDVVLAAGPEEAISIVDEHEGRFDLLVSDVVMPGISGLQLAARLRERTAISQALFMSGYLGDVQGVLGGENRLLRKPFTPETLLAAVRSAIEGPRV